jgi:hypothetical protein
VSYHTHNLRDGDIFCAPNDLEAYADLSYIDRGLVTHLFEVLDVEHSSLRDGRYPDVCGRLDKNGYYMHLVARCLKCDEMLNVVVSQDISLCMEGYGPEDGEPGWVEGYEDVNGLVNEWKKCE